MNRYEALVTVGISWDEDASFVLLFSSGSSSFLAIWARSLGLFHLCV